MAVDRTHLPAGTRFVLLEEFERDTDIWRSSVDTKMERVTSRVDILGAKLAVYTTVGAVIGGAFAAGVARLFFG